MKQQERVEKKRRKRRMRRKMIPITLFGRLSD